MLGKNWKISSTSSHYTLYAVRSDRVLINGFRGMVLAVDSMSAVGVFRNQQGVCMFMLQSVTREWYNQKWVLGIFNEMGVLIQKLAPFARMP